MSSIGDLVVNLGLNSGGFTTGLAASNRGLTSLAGGVTRSVAMIKGALAPLAPIAAAVGVAMGFTSAINSARDAVQQQNKLEAVLKATGGAAGLTSNQMMDLANDMSYLTNFEDDAVVGAQAVLATFKEVKGDQFKEGTRLAADMASVLGGDLNGSIMQVGKALNDPTKGITALARAGVSFTEQQKQQIKSMQASGDMVGAQQIILKELRSEFGGAAEAMADPFTKMQNVIGNVGESVGMLLLPAVNAVANGFSQALGPLANGGDTFGAIGEQIGTLVSGVIQPFVSIFRTGIEFVVAGFGMLGPVISGVQELVTSLSIGLQQMFQPVYDGIMDLISSFLPSLMGGFEATGGFIGEVVGGIAFFFRNMSALSQIALIDLYTWVMDNVPGMEGFYTHFAATVVGVFSGIGAFVKSFVANVIAGFQEIVNFGIAAFGAVADAFAAMLDGKNPLTAFQDSFTNTLASQKDVQGGGNPFAEFGKAFSESRDGMLSDIAAGGGLKNVMATRKEDLLAEVAKNEAAFSLGLQAPQIKAPGGGSIGSAGAGGSSSGTGDKYVKTEALQQGSKEAFSAIQSFLFGGQGDTAKQQLSVQQQQLDATGEQNAVLAEIRDGMAEDRSAREMDPGVAF